MVDDDNENRLHIGRCFSRRRVVLDAIRHLSDQTGCSTIEIARCYCQLSSQSERNIINRSDRADPDAWNW